jgi:ElaB/YqjD/DUF883 family membrane-anchored ribosome-binding protein
MTSHIDKETDTSHLDRVRETASAARARANDAYRAAREQASTAYDTARSRARKARQQASGSIDSNPVTALIGGFALGGLLAAILPRTQREEELLGDYGRQINDKARQAVRAATEAGKAKLEELGYNEEAARKKVAALKSDAVEIARAAAERAQSAQG